MNLLFGRRGADGCRCSRPNCHSVVAAVAQSHCRHGNTIRVQASGPSLSRLLFVLFLCPCNSIKRARHPHLLFVCVSFLGSRLEDFASLSSQVKWKFSAKTLGIEDDEEPVGTFTALDTIAFEDLVSVVKFGTETITLAKSGRLKTKAA